MESTFVDHIGGLFAAFRYDEIGAEVVGGSLKLSKRELREIRDAPGPTAKGTRSVGRLGRAVIGLSETIAVDVVVVEVVVIGFGV